MNRREKLRLLQAAEGYFQSGNHVLARMTLDNLVAADATSSRAFELLGYIHASAGDLAEANRCLDKACRLPGAAPEAFYYLGASHLKLGDARSAIAAFDRAMALAGPFFEALHDRGTAWSMLGSSAAALESYAKALQFKPDSFDLLFNLGKVHDQRREFAEAIAFYDRALKLDPGAADVWAHKGAALYDAQRYAEAIEHWERALEIDGSIEFLPGFVLHARLRLCDWRGWEADRTALLERVRQGDSACGPFEMLALTSDESLQLRSAEHWVAALSPLRLPPARFERRARDKLRIAYFSADFGRHPVSYLTAELFERHDRDAFEVHAFALRGAAADDDMRARLVRAFDQFVEVEQLGDLEIVERARRSGIDIAIDLGGHTKGSRTALFKERVAPIQVSYLGYPGTMGADFVDYLIADATIVPESAWPFYSERVVQLPDCFQPSDTTRPTSDAPPDRSAYGLPAQGFVYCSFNNTYKLNPEVFGLWMQILREAEGSCLWLLGDSDEVRRNLRHAAAAQGVDPDRLAFGGRVSQRDYLHRYGCADLFLDTLPFNAGTTANDALWAGLPVLTRPGMSFAGRMAASLLEAVGLPDLVVDTPQAYVSTAVRLARRPDEFAAIKARLECNRRSAPLFDMQRYTRCLEAAYRDMHRRWQDGLPPAPIRVARPEA